MSRWIETFKNHPFQTSWENVKKSIKDLKVDNTTPTDVQELARLKKVIKYVGEIINACDPELIPQSVWDNFNSQSTECFNQISSFVGNRNIGHLQNANKNADNLLTYVRPYMINSKSAAVAAGKAFKSYSDTIVQEIINLNDTTKIAVEDIKHNFQQSEEMLTSLSQVEDKVKNLDSYLFEKNKEDDDNGVEFKVKKIHEKINTIHSEIEDYYGVLFNGKDEEKGSIKHQISDALSEATIAKEKIDGELLGAEDKLDPLKTFYTSVFGSKNEETGEIEGGLKLEIHEKRKKYNALLKEIEGLLPGAVSAGLASAYNEVKRSFEKPIRHNSGIFYFSLFALFATSFFIITKEITISPFQITFEDISNTTRMLSMFLYKLPIVIPIIWLAIYSSKRRSEAQRLHQEYTHKETIAKSYQGFKKQINELKESDDLMKKLLDTAILAIADNASATLDKKHEEKTPLQEILNSLSKKLDKFPIKKNSGE